jgi:hypothetical protein
LLKLGRGLEHQLPIDQLPIDQLQPVAPVSDLQVPVDVEALDVVVVVVVSNVVDEADLVEFTEFVDVDDAAVEDFEDVAGDVATDETVSDEDAILELVEAWLKLALDDDEPPKK